MECIGYNSVWILEFETQFLAERMGGEFLTEWMEVVLLGAGWVWNGVTWARNTVSRRANESGFS